MIELQSVEKTYPNGFKALTNINLKINQGEFFALLGPSGCGKTTLLRILAGLVKPTSGRILFDGKDVTDIPANERRVNMVFQSYAVFQHMTVFQNIAYGLKVDRVPKDEMQQRVKEALQLVKLEGKENNMPDELSGGQKQRVAVARALVKNPFALLLDEPLSALDAKLRESMRSELMKIQKKTGITFIFVTHDQSEALSMAHQIAVMNNGEIIQKDRPYAIYETPKTSFVADFIGSANFLLANKKEQAGEALIEIQGIKPFPFKLPADWPASFHFSLRPENISLLKKEPEPPNIYIAGLIEEIVYFGEKIHIKVKTDSGQTLSCFLSDYERKLLGNIQEKERVWCFWENVDLHPLRD